MNWFNSLSKMWQVVVVILLLLFVIYLYRQYGYKLKSLLQTKDIKTSTVVDENGDIIVVSSQSDLTESMKNNLQDLAGRIKQDIYGINITHDMDLYKKAAALSDAEIDYLASYYKRNMTNGTSLFEDMDNELVSCYVQDCSGWNDLFTKLQKTGNR